MALLITRAKHRTLKNPSLIHLFSTSSQNDTVFPPPSSPPQQQQQNQSSASAFSDVKATLRNQETKKTTIDGMKIDDIRKSLSQFRSRNTGQSVSPGQNEPNQPPKPFSFQQRYKEMGMSNNNYNAAGGDSGKGGSSVRSFQLNKIKESLRNITGNRNIANNNAGRSNAGKVSFLNDTTKLVFGSDLSKASVIGGSEGSPLKKDNKVGGRERRELLIQPYSHGELGLKLKALRPEVEGEGKGWFSIKELNERLKKVRENDEKAQNDSVSRMGIGSLRDTLDVLKESSRDQNEKQKLAFISPMTMNSWMTSVLGDPKEELVEKYFHPDNMSSAEKLKIELSKVQKEFKMSESDCGSARVQVAQLTTKIKHLSTVLHKKDKHSRKGLQEMVQQRKKLLKYLRRTDWDSYCFVISKLGLRDNADFKYLVRN